MKSTKKMRLSITLKATSKRKYNLSLLIILLKIFPPSNGYKGRRLNSAKDRLAKQNTFRYTYDSGKIQYIAIQKTHSPRFKRGPAMFIAKLSLLNTSSSSSIDIPNMSNLNCFKLYPRFVATYRCAISCKKRASI